MAPPPVSPPDRHSLIDVRLVGLEPICGPISGKKQKQTYISKNKNSGPAIQVRLRLPFVTATFVAFSVALAEELTCKDTTLRRKLVLYDPFSLELYILVSIRIINIIYAGPSHSTYVRQNRTIRRNLSCTTHFYL